MTTEEMAVLLRDRGLTIAVAESCTGGLLGAELTSLPGSSVYMRGGVIAYSNEVKVQLLHVAHALIAQHGAVSAEVARALAAGAKTACGADIGVGVTGVAGPDATDAKPAGLIYVCVDGPQGVAEKVLHEDLGREANRRQAVVAAIELIGLVAKQSTAD